MKSFLTDDIIDSIGKFTNEYANILKNDPVIQEKLENNKRALLSKWVPVDRDDIWMYLTVTLMMGIVQKPILDFYWTNDGLFQTPIYSRLMSHQRYREI